MRCDLATSVDDPEKRNEKVQRPVTSAQRCSPCGTGQRQPKDRLTEYVYGNQVVNCNGKKNDTKNESETSTRQDVDVINGRRPPKCTDLYECRKKGHMVHFYAHIISAGEKLCNNLSFSFLLSPSYFQLNTYDIHTYDENR